MNASPLLHLVLLLLAQCLEATSTSTDTGRLYNFDGEYGKDYRAFIRTVIPGYDAFLDISGDILAASNSKKILVIGPGRGDELVAIAKALPDATITAYEASGEMVKACQQQVNEHNLSDRITIIEEAFNLEEDESCSSSDGLYDAITVFNVLHFLPVQEQRQFVKAAATKLVPGGVLLLSGNSLPKNFGPNHPLSSISGNRWKRFGMSDQKHHDIISSIGKTLFNVSPEHLDPELEQLSFTPLEEAFRSLGNAMWYTYKREG